MIMAVVFCQSASAQSFWKTDDCENFTLLQAGYMSDTYNADGFFVGYKHGWNITGEKLPLYIEPGFEFQYVKFPWMHRIGFTVPVDFSYKFKSGDFTISPVTGPTLRYAHDWNDTGSENEFIFGWDFGGRIAYKKIALEYRYNKGISGDSWNTHQIGIGFLF